MIVERALLAVVIATGDQARAARVAKRRWVKAVENQWKET